MTPAPGAVAPLPRALDDVLAGIAAGAAERDRAPEPRFPGDAWAALARGGLTAVTIGGAPAARELGLVRAVAAADVSVARILDGHLNGVERARVHLPAALREEELSAVAHDGACLGVWGADPRPGEGSPATLDRARGPARLSGVKTFCSGAGGTRRAWVLTRAPGDTAAVRLAYVDTTADVEVDPTWYRGAGMRASVSHRVVFHGAQVLWVAPEAGALLAQPWFARDAIRTAASWAGGADAAVADALDQLAARPAPTELEGLAAGRLRIALGTIDLWLAEAARRMDAGDELSALAVDLRAALAGAVRDILDEAARACGSWPFAVGTVLERVRRDLGTFVLQHRLDPIVARAGLAALRERPPA